MSRQSSLAEALQQRQRLEALQSQTSWPGMGEGGGRLTIKTRVKHTNGGGARGNSRLAQMQRSRSQAAQLRHTQPFTPPATASQHRTTEGTTAVNVGDAAPADGQRAQHGAAPLMSRRMSNPLQAQQHKAGGAGAGSCGMVRKTSATLDIPAHQRIQKAATCPDELTDDVIAAAIAAANVHGPCGGSRGRHGTTAGSSRAASTAGQSPPSAFHHSAHSRHGTPPLPRVHWGAARSRSRSSTTTPGSSCMSDTPPTQRAQHARQRSGSMWGSPASDCAYCCHMHSPSSPSLRTHGHGSSHGEGEGIRQLFEARSAAATAHAQVQCLNAALTKEREEAEQLRSELRRLAMERDELRKTVAMCGEQARQAQRSGAPRLAPRIRSGLHGSSSQDVFSLQDTEE